MIPGLFKTVWIESLIIMAASLGAAALLHPEDPFMFHGDFLWLMLAPLFLALRHGFAAGFFVQLMILTLVTAGWRLSVPGVEQFPTTILLGITLVVMLAGEFSDYWQRRLLRDQIAAEHWDYRMQEFTRSYHLLKVSHDQMVEQLAGSTVSLRQAMSGVRHEMLKDKPSEQEDLLAAHAEAVLGLFRRYGTVQSGALYRVVNHQVVVQPLASAGTVPEQSPVDSLIVREALEKAEMISVLSTDSGSPRYVDGDILAVVPIQDMTGFIHAVLIVFRIPFLRFNNETLSLIAVMGASIGDLLHETGVEQQSETEAGVVFQHELKRSIRYARHHGVEAHVVSLEMHENLSLNGLLAQRRSLDTVWLRRHRDGHPIVLWLMPFTDAFAVAGFQARMNVWGSQQHAVEAGDDAQLTFHLFSVAGKGDADALMDEIASVCGLSDV